jgi:hypothetical protein
VKPLNGSSYIPLPEWVANKKAVIKLMMEIIDVIMSANTAVNSKQHQKKD